MSKGSDKKEIHEILEKQRGAFCQIAFIYFTAVMIGLGVITSQQATLGEFTIVADLVMLISLTIVFAYLTRGLYIPVTEIDRLTTNTLRDIVSQALPEEGD